MKKCITIVCLLCLVLGMSIFMVVTASADAGFVINEGILQKYTGNSEKVVIPGNVTIIGASAFDENDTITEVVMPANLREIQSSAFQGCDNLKKVTMNDKVTKIGQMSFRNCTKLESIVIPESVNFIGSAAFQYCSSLKSINIPQKVTTIEYGAFSGCGSLTEISVSESNTKYKDENGVLFDTYESMLVSYPAGKKDASYVVPDGTYVVERLAFWEATNLTEVTLPETLRTLNVRSIAHCKMINEMHIPASVTKIDDGAFEECRALKRVYVMNDRVSFGSDVFMGVPGVELYGGIGSTAEEYAGMMRIAFHVVETGTTDESQEDDEKAESSGKDLTRWILFFGIVLVGCMVVLFGILMVRRIGKKGRDDMSESNYNIGLEPHRISNIRTDQAETTAFEDETMDDGKTENPKDPDGTWVLGQDGINDQSGEYENRNGTQALWRHGGVIDQLGGHESRDGIQVPGSDWNNNDLQGELSGQNKTLAFVAQGTGNMYGNEGTALRGASAKTGAGIAGECTCKVCGALNNPAQAYCKICGAVIQGKGRIPYSSPKEADTVVCARCGLKNRKGGKFCINCGSRL